MMIGPPCTIMAEVAQAHDGSLAMARAFVEAVGVMPHASDLADHARTMERVEAFLPRRAASV